MRVAIIGPPFSGKSTLFRALAEAGGSQVDVSRADQPHLAVVKVPDDRLQFLADLYHPEKFTPAELEVLDLPGFDLAADASRAKSRQHWAAMRQCDLILLVARAFHNDAAPAYRNRVDAAQDAEELQAEMLFADHDQVSARVERLEGQLKKPANHEATLRELDLMRRFLDALEHEQPLRSAVRNPEEEKSIRSFAFLSLKPQLVVVNCDESAAGEPGPGQLSGVDAIQLSARIEEEIAQLPAADRPAFLADLGLTAIARDRLIQACFRKLNMISMFTAGEDECRAWPMPAGTDAVTAAAEIHSDIARGFIRAETMGYADFLAAGGDTKQVKAAGKLRLEGKQYVVQDGDIINFRFHV